MSNRMIWVAVLAILVWGAVLAVLFRGKSAGVTEPEPEETPAHVEGPLLYLPLPRHPRFELSNLKIVDDDGAGSRGRESFSLDWTLSSGEFAREMKPWVVVRAADGGYMKTEMLTTDERFALATGEGAVGGGTLTFEVDELSVDRESDGPLREGCEVYVVIVEEGMLVAKDYISYERTYKVSNSLTHGNVSPSEAVPLPEGVVEDEE